MKIVCDDKIPFLRGVFEPYAEVVYLPGARTTADDVRDADAIVTRTRTICDRTLLEGSSVKVIASATIGYDHIDTQWCDSHGIVWANAPGCNSGSVKQYVASALANLAMWHGLDLESMTLGVVGVGNVGRKVADVGRAFGMRVLLNDPPRARREGSGGFVDLDTVVRESDIVTVHVPLARDGQDPTWHLFDAARIAAMRGDQFLINSSRGPVVDNTALKEALKSGALGHAVLDVYEGEPNPDPELIELLDLTTPHIAGYSADGKANGTAISVRTVARVLGLPLTDWSASDVPDPRQTLEFAADASGRSRQDVLIEAVLHTYDVLDDDHIIRIAPQDFEQYRGDYGVRREPSAFTLKLKGASAQMVESLKLIGFNVIAI